MIFQSFKSESVGSKLCWQGHFQAGALENNLLREFISSDWHNLCKTLVHTYAKNS